MRWSNIPIPEAHLVGLVIGAILQFFFSNRLFQLPLTGFALGLFVLIVGIGLCAWSVIEAKDMNIASPNMLLEGGPYTFSRNPMYVGWMLIYLGISFTANSLWIIVFLPFIIGYIHFVDIRREEQFLKTKFGDQYLEYQERVRRYL